MVLIGVRVQVGYTSPTKTRPNTAMQLTERGAELISVEYVGHSARALIKAASAFGGAVILRETK